MKPNLKKSRESLKMTQKQVASYLGTKLRMYQHLEAGTRKGTVETWEKLSELFGVPISELRKDETQ